MCLRLPRRGSESRIDSRRPTTRTAARVCLRLAPSRSRKTLNPSREVTMLRRLCIILCATALAMGATLLGEGAARAETTTFRVATLAPRESPWGKVFNAWQKGIKEASHGQLEL